YLELTLGVEHARYSLFGDVVAFTLVAVVGFVFGTWWGRGAFARATGWLVEVRTPSDVERRAVLDLPGRQAAQSFVFWVVASVIYLVGNGFLGHHAIGHGIRISGGIVLGGVVTCRSEERRVGK